MAGWSNLLRLMVTALILFIISACSSPQSASIRFALASAPISLDPRFATDAMSSRINRLLYQRLVDFDEQIAKHHYYDKEQACQMDEIIAEAEQEKG